MKIEMEDLSPVRKKMRVEIPQEETEKTYEQVSKKIASMARIPGFRPGKAPLGLIRSRFRNEIKDELVHELLPRSYDEAVKSKDLKPLASPHIERLDFQPGQPLMYEAVFEVTPQFELGQYNGLALQKRAAPVTDEEVQGVVAQLRERLAKLIPVENRPAAPGDQLSVDIEGAPIDRETGEPSPQAPLREEGVSLTLDGANTLPEFSDSLRGAAVGEVREFTVHHPDGSERGQFAGKSVRYRVAVRAIREKKLPELDDEFAKELGEGLETLEQVTARVREDLELRRRQETETLLQEQAVDQLLQQNRFEIPDVLVEERVQAKLQRVAYDLARRGLDASRAGVDWEKLRQEWRQPSEREVRAALILGRIAEVEGLAPGEDEVDQELERIASLRRQTIEQVALEYEKENRMEELRDRLKSRKAMALVLQQANIQEVAP